MRHLYHPCMVFSIAGVLFALALGAAGELGSANAAGVPWAVPAAGSAALILVAEAFWRRGLQVGGDLAALYRALGTCYAVGAACGAQVPILGVVELTFGDRPPAALAWLLVLAVPRVLYLLSRLAWRLPSRGMRASAAAAWCAVAVVVAAIATGPPAAPLTAAVVAGGVWVSLAAAPAALLVWLPR